MGTEFHLGPGDILFEDAGVLRHASTSPHRGEQERIALVLYLGKYLDDKNHGKDTYRLKKAASNTGKRATGTNEKTQQKKRKLNE